MLKGNKIYFTLFILIVLAGVFLRIYPFESKSWISEYDTQIVGQALDLGKGVLNKDFALAFENVKYPYFLPYIFLFFYASFYFIGSFFGLFSSSEEFTNYILFNSEQFYWQSRLVVGFFGIALFVLIYLIVRRIFLGTKNNYFGLQSKAKGTDFSNRGRGRAKLRSNLGITDLKNLVPESRFAIQNNNIILGALLACFLSAFSLLSIQFSQQVRPHIPVACLIALTYYLYLLFLERKSNLLFFLMVVSSALCVGTFISGIFALVFPVLSYYFVFGKKNLFSLKLLSAVLVFFICVLLFYPHVFLGLKANLNKAQTGLSVSFLGTKFSIDSLGLGFTTILKTLFLHEIALGILLVVFLLLRFGDAGTDFLNRRCGRAPSAKRRAGISDLKNFVPASPDNVIYYHQAIIGWWGFVLSFGLSFGLIDNGWRYRALLPLVAFLCIGAGILFINLFDLILKKKFLISLVIFLLCFHLMQAGRLVYLISQPYTIQEASQWIKRNIASSKTVVFQKAFPEIVPTKESIKKQAELSGVLGRREQALLNLNDSDYPKEAIGVIRFDYLTESVNNDVLGTYMLIKRIRPEYFVISSRSLDEEERNSYLEYQMANFYGEKIQEFIPFTGKAKVLSFPSGLDNPLTDLWQARQFGPSIEIYKMNWSNE